MKMSSESTREVTYEPPHMQTNSAELWTGILNLQEDDSTENHFETDIANWFCCLAEMLHSRNKTHSSLVVPYLFSMRSDLEKPDLESNANKQSKPPCSVDANNRPKEAKKWLLDKNEDRLATEKWATQLNNLIISSGNYESLKLSSALLMCTGWATVAYIIL